MKSIQFLDREFAITGRLGDPYFDNIENDQNSNLFLLKAAAKFIGKDSVVCDIGANIGVTTCLFSSLAPNGRVHSFEPSHENRHYLSKNINDNHLNNVTIHPIAIGSENKTLSFFEDPGSGSASHLVDSNASYGQRTIGVKCRRLDDFIIFADLERVNFIKIDVEGFEKSVLDGAAETLADYNPVVFLEFNSFTLMSYGNTNPKEFLDQICDMFPYVYTFQNGTFVRIETAPDRLSFIHRNLIHHGCVDDLLCTFNPA